MRIRILKSCPFCGNIDITITNHHNMMVFVQCEDCGATFPHFDTEEQAVDAWNRRDK